MKGFKNILVVISEIGEEQSALTRAAALAEAHRAQLKVVHVVKLPSREMEVLKIYMDPGEFQQMIVTERARDLETLVAPFKEQGIRVQTKVLMGIPFLEIVREVLRGAHDLLVVTAEGKGGLQEVLFGTTTMHLMRKCPCPVWAIKPAKRPRMSRILAAIDPDPSDQVKSSLNIKVLRLAQALAQFEKGELHIIHAWALHGEGLLRARALIPVNKVDQLVRETQKAHGRWLDEFLQRQSPGFPKSRVHLLRGDAGILIPELARKKRIELIVMGTVGRTGISGLFIGNTAERVLQQVGCSVLAVKPQGYVTPVRIDQG